MEKLERKIPPVVVFIILIVIINRVSHEFTALTLPLPLNALVFAACFILSGVIGVAGVFQFHRANTTIHPVKVEDASTVVQTGIFAYTRNPMYLALFLLLVGYAYWHQNVLAIALAFTFIPYMTRFQIKPEERALEKLFGEEYRQYKQRVRRWI
ncbi:methyltransferase family protein [Vibrio japonicus]|uniref:Isoprenylcysteine carboxylmethyltransferase family protein n=1 Tax=Vibrio japonicus TaxID=1824638 RepID=A0ABY5LFC0_9VIBR|nr:isoprenylcysteine carboxylmethyltransferase family protein [Vibrio japonicus]UUM29528.1 isoprenylcysteine carboxylmethyltransferase family protein [Vibrio japonicus]